MQRIYVQCYANVQKGYNNTSCTTQHDHCHQWRADTQGSWVVQVVVGTSKHNAELWLLPTWKGPKPKLRSFKARSVREWRLLCMTESFDRPVTRCTIHAVRRGSDIWGLEMETRTAGNSIQDILTIILSSTHLMKTMRRGEELFRFVWRLHSIRLANEPFKD